MAIIFQAVWSIIFTHPPAYYKSELNCQFSVISIQEVVQNMYIRRIPALILKAIDVGSRASKTFLANQRATPAMAAVITHLNNI
jgi:hypothetical protein